MIKRLLLAVTISILNPVVLFAQDSVCISGCVTDFNNNPLDSVLVSIKNKKFEEIYSTKTDIDGRYSMNVAKGNYYCLYAVKPSEYFKTKLEYWTWNVPAFTDLEINPQYDRMEIYGINAFEPQVTPQETYMVYFRPMSLRKVLKLSDLKNRKGFEEKAIANSDTIDIAPKIITPEELTVCMNGHKTEVLNVSRMPVYGRGSYYYGYVIQIKKPEKNSSMVPKYDYITITLLSKETHEQGRGDCFIKRIE